MSTAASPPASSTPRLIVVMGVAGAGKTEVGSALAEALGATFLEADEFHPPSNIEKMSKGTPLTDEDRWPWLAALGKAMGEVPEGRVVAACSALKRAYREAMTAAAGEPVFFVLLDGSRELIAARMAARPHHFMPTSLLDSQFATLERPGEDECAAAVGIDGSIAEIVEDIRQRVDPA